MADQVVIQSISLYPQQLAVLDAIGQANGGLGRSATIRLVLERFTRQEKALDIVRAHLAGAIDDKGALAMLKALVRAKAAEPAIPAPAPASAGVTIPASAGMTGEPATAEPAAQGGTEQPGYRERAGW